MTEHSAADHHQLLRELLQLCEEFFGQASPVTREELDTFLRARGHHGGPGLLIDLLGFARYRLEQPQRTDDTGARNNA